MTYLNKIKAWREARGMTQQGLAEAAGLYKSYISELERGLKPFNQELLIRLGEVLGVSETDLVGHDPNHSSGTLPIRFVTGGGAWVEADDYSQDHLGHFNATSVPGYERIPQWFEKLEGDSMNKLFPTGTYLQVADAAELNYTPQHGDIVILERMRDGGFLRERSAKQVERVNNEFEFWPRSTNSRWQKPITLNDHGHDDSVTVTVVGVVLRAIIDYSR